MYLSTQKKEFFILFFVTISSLASFYTLNAQNCTPDSLGNITCSDFRLNSTLNIDLRLASKHNPTTNKLIYSSQNPTKGEYIRNPNCWAAGLDLTCASPWNSRGVYLQAGTLITPRHAILAAHFSLPIGASIKFVANDNSVVSRKIIGSAINTNSATIFPDIQIVTLDSDVPSTISPCQLLPSGSEKYINNYGKGLPGFFLDQEEKANVADVVSLGIGGMQNFTFAQPTDSNRLAMYEPVVMGDSGNPVFVVLSGKVVLIGVITSYGPWGYSLNYFGNLPFGQTMPDMRLDDLIKASDLTCGIETNYKVSFFDFSNTSSEIHLINDRNLIYAKGKTIIVSTERFVQIVVCDLTGKQILNQFSDGNNCYSVPNEGVYLVKIIDENNRQSVRKLLIK